MLIIDTPILYPHKRKKYCHLLSDDLNELHQFAAALNIKRGWFEKSSSGVPHYDLNEEQWRAAIDAGAIEVTHRGLVTFMKKYYL